MNIKTSFWAKPIPYRQFDWSAIDDDTYDAGCPIGYGKTEADAVYDLLLKLEDKRDE